MLSDTDKENLIGKGILLKTDSYVRDNDLRVYRFRDEKYYYYLNDHYNKWLDTYLESVFNLFYDLRKEFENRINTQLEFSIPKKGLRLEILEKEHQKYLSEIEKFEDYQVYCYSATELFGYCRIALIFSLDRLLELKGSEIKVVGLNIFDKESNEYNSLKDYLNLCTAKFNMQWLLEQIQIEKELNELVGNNENITKLHIDSNISIPKKLKWIGTPAQFGFIINELIGKGYIDKPTGSYNKDAEFYLSIFNIETSQGNLSNEVNINKNSFSSNNAGKFKIPFKDKLS